MIDDPARGKFPRSDRIGIEFEIGRAVPAAIGAESAKTDTGQDFLGVALTTVRTIFPIANILAQPESLVLQDAVAIVLAIAIGSQTVTIAKVVEHAGLTKPLPHEVAIAAGVRAAVEEHVQSPGQAAVQTFAAAADDADNLRAGRI
jgi:hypothetical protein